MNRKLRSALNALYKKISKPSNENAFSLEILTETEAKTNGGHGMPEILTTQSQTRMEEIAN